MLVNELLLYGAQYSATNSSNKTPMDLTKVLLSLYGCPSAPSPLQGRERGRGRGRGGGGEGGGGGGGGEGLIWPDVRPYYYIGYERLHTMLDLQLCSSLPQL